MDLQTTKISPPAAKRDRISKPVMQACELLATGECTTVKAAAARVGISREWLSRSLSTSRVQAFIAHEARQTIAVSTMRASQVMVGLLGAKSDHVRMQASDRILASEGILKSDQRDMNVNVAVSAGFVVDLSTPVSKPVVTIDAE